MSPIKVADLIALLEKVPKDARVLVEISGDSDFEAVRGLCSFRVEPLEDGGHGVALDIGWRWKHHPSEEFPPESA